MADSAYWKERYDDLRVRVAILADDTKFEREKQPATCISEASEFFMSNSMEVVDNEEYAQDNWGEGNYFKVVRTDRLLEQVKKALESALT